MTSLRLISLMYPHLSYSNTARSGLRTFLLPHYVDHKYPPARSLISTPRYTAMFFLRLSTSVLVCYIARLALAERNDGVRLAIGPTCKPLSITGATGDVNAGIQNIRKFKTIVRDIPHLKTSTSTNKFSCRFLLGTGMIAFIR